MEQYPLVESVCLSEWSNVISLERLYKECQHRQTGQKIVGTVDRLKLVIRCCQLQLYKLASRFLLILISTKEITLMMIIKLSNFNTTVIHRLIAIFRFLEPTKNRFPDRSQNQILGLTSFVPNYSW